MFGVVAKDPEPRTSAAGKPYMRINLRVGDGDAAQWVLVTVFGAAVAELAGRAVRGATLYCEGRLNLDRWTGQDGRERCGLSMAAWRCEVPKIGRDKPKRERSPRKPAAAAVEDGGTTAVGRKPARPFNDLIPF